MIVRLARVKVGQRQAKYLKTPLNLIIEGGFCYGGFVGTKNPQWGGLALYRSSLAKRGRR